MKAMTLMIFQIYLTICLLRFFGLFVRFLKFDLCLQCNRNTHILLSYFISHFSDFQPQLDDETKSAVENFYFRPDICYAMPGMKDEMTIWKEGKKNKA